MKTIILYTLLQLTFIWFLVELFHLLRPVNAKEKEEERKKDYLKLQNMTTQEIMIFKNKNEFIKDVGCYDVLREFCNDDEIIKKCYPNYKRVK